jgi:hypothetical protein
MIQKITYPNYSSIRKTSKYISKNFSDSKLSEAAQTAINSTPFNLTRQHDKKFQNIKKPSFWSQYFSSNKSNVDQNQLGYAVRAMMELLNLSS